MQEQIEVRRVSYLISIWAKSEGARRLWQGSLQTLAGQQFFFETLEELKRLLTELGGWVDPADLQD